MPHASVDVATSTWILRFSNNSSHTFRSPSVKPAWWIPIPFINNSIKSASLHLAIYDRISSWLQLRKYWSLVEFKYPFDNSLLRILTKPWAVSLVCLLDVTKIKTGLPSDSWLIFWKIGLFIASIQGQYAFSLKPIVRMVTFTGLASMPKLNSPFLEQPIHWPTSYAHESAVDKHTNLTLAFMALPMYLMRETITSSTGPLSRPSMWTSSMITKPTFCT